MKVQMKPETIERRARERAEAQQAQRADLRARVVKLCDGSPGSDLWVDMLAEIDAAEAARVAGGES